MGAGEGSERGQGFLGSCFKVKEVDLNFKCGAWGEGCKSAVAKYGMEVNGPFFLRLHSLDPMDKAG